MIEIQRHAKSREQRMPRLIYACLDFDRAEIATIIAALHHWRDSTETPGELDYIACGFGEFAVLDASDIDRLIHRFTLEAE
ncbi:hypothetical protein [Shinella sp. HZN7]|uniref:hypothetical protein n=1 Tax=Shinella sp. (strain HZN7) TaxID=879274 RepID=UPI0007DAB354|nr:hypothetical protein [Shinella sp. HZN7]ANH08555.1 hypothetical protein shn_30880 [Shinella sp. HZN7]